LISEKMLESTDGGFDPSVVREEWRHWRKEPKAASSE